MHIFVFAVGKANGKWFSLKPFTSFLEILYDLIYSSGQMGLINHSNDIRKFVMLAAKKKRLRFALIKY